MSGCKECQALSRRSFLARSGAGLGALALGDSLLRFAAPTYAATAGGTGNILVLCELAGGLDALSFLAPFQHAAYQDRRPQLALRSSEVTPLPDQPNMGINNQFGFFSQLYAQNELAIVQQVAYPDGNGSHFESQDIFDLGVRRLGGTSTPWYERLRKTYFDEPFGVMNTRRIGDPQRYGYPDTTGRRAAQDAFGRLAALKKDDSSKSEREKAILDAYSRIDVNGAVIRERTENFTSSGTARGEFYRAAALASADLGTQIFKVSYGGFDTHASQITANERLFPRVNNEFQQFVTDLRNLGVWDRTTVVFYSEFGRRNFENGSPGTDHGYGGHMMLAGPRVNAGLHGQTVTTSDLQRNSLPYYVDFRAVFGSCIRDWLGFDPRPIFEINGETYDTAVGSALFR